MIWPENVFTGSNAKLTGAAGTVESVITPPFPSVEDPDEPIMLVATSFAQTLDPVLRLNGVDMRVASEIVQLFAEITVAIVPSQLGRAWL